MRIEEFDVLVVGAGLSGLREGLELSMFVFTKKIRDLYIREI